MKVVDSLLFDLLEGKAVDGFPIQRRLRRKLLFKSLTKMKFKQSPLRFSKLAIVGSAFFSIQKFLILTFVRSLPL